MRRTTRAAFAYFAALSLTRWSMFGKPPDANSAILKFRMSENPSPPSDDGSRFRRARSRCAEARRSSRGFRVARRELSGYPRPARGEYTNSAKNRRNELYLICCRGLRDLLGDSGRARYSFSTRRTTRRRRAGRDTPSIANSPARFGGSLIVSSIGSFCRPRRTTVIRIHFRRYSKSSTRIASIGATVEASFFQADFQEHRQLLRFSYPFCWRRRYRLVARVLETWGHF